MSDYLKFLEEIGVTPEQMAKAVLQGIPYISTDTPKVNFLNSVVHGTGTFCFRSLESGELIGEALRENVWTKLGRFANHAAIPNMGVERTRSGINFIANQDIPEGDELTVNYREVKEALEMEAP